MTHLSHPEWLTRAEHHFSRVHLFASAARKRASRREKHPIYDFLTQYYPFSLGKFEKWQPGLGVSLANADPELFRPLRYHYSPDGTATLRPDTLTEKEHTRLHFTLNLLRETQARPAFHGCFGLHEWAMVYSGSDARHRTSAPFRLPQKDIDALVRSRPLNCTHFDAFRFFAPAAQPMNKHQPTLHDRIHLEQPGCIHTNMDLYKWAFKALPWVGSDLVWECFQLALQAREIDMRASPYDLEKWHYPPICIETEEGKLLYVQHQKELQKTGSTLRAKLIASLETLLTSAAPPSLTASTSCKR